MDTPRVPEDQIRARAYSLWEADGCAERHWQQAEAELFSGTESRYLPEARNASTAELHDIAPTGDAPSGRSRRRA